jgi:hypothetical protein
MRLRSEPSSNWTMTLLESMLCRSNNSTFKSQIFQSSTYLRSSPSMKRRALLRTNWLVSNKLSKRFNTIRFQRSMSSTDKKRDFSRESKCMNQSTLKWHPRLWVLNPESLSIKRMKPRSNTQLNQQLMSKLSLVSKRFTMNRRSEKSKENINLLLSHSSLIRALVDLERSKSLKRLLKR